MGAEPPAKEGDMEVEFGSGMSWIKNDQISGMGDQPREIRRATEVVTNGCKLWIDEDAAEHRF